MYFVCHRHAYAVALSRRARRIEGVSSASCIWLQYRRGCGRCPVWLAQRITENALRDDMGHCSRRSWVGDVRTRCNVSPSWCMDGVNWAIHARDVDRWCTSCSVRTQYTSFGGPLLTAITISTHRRQTHLSKTLSVEELTPTTVTINAFACLGFVVGPSFALLFEYLPSFCMVGKSFCVNQLTAPGTYTTENFVPFQQNK